MIRSLYHLLERGAEAQPDAIVLRMSGQTLTYAEFCGRVNAVASYLHESGVRRPDRVGLLMGRSLDSVAAIFGVMAAGGAYVPIDPSAPTELSGVMLKNAGARYLLADPALTDQVTGIVKEHDGIRTIGGLGTGSSPSFESIYAGYDRLKDFGLNERDLAMMFHTSGTTGVPKGVAHSHRSMLSVVEWAVDEFQLRSDDVFIGVTSHSFELSWFELFASILARGQIVLAPDEWVRFSPGEVAQLAASSRVSVWCSVPSLLMRLSERGDLPERDLSALRRIHFAGERFPVKHLRRLMQQVPHPRYTNMLGTTETHICAFHEFKDGPPGDDVENIPVGKACAHINLGAIGKNGELVPDGEIGELVVRGPCLMNGYWQLPERTAQAIIDVRFGPDLVDKAYRTGDLVRKDERGDYHIIGRADRRIKVSGHLVDLDEVEAVLLANEAVLEGAAFSAGDEGFEHVEAAVVPKQGQKLSAAELRVHTSRKLPLYAVPERIFVLSALPRLDNGKISRRAVQATGASKANADSSVATDARPVDAARRFIAERILEDPAFEIDESLDLLSTNLLSSMSVVSLVTFIEQTYGVTVPNEEFVADNFRSLKEVGDLIARLRGSR